MFFCNDGLFAHARGIVASVTDLGTKHKQRRAQKVEHVCRSTPARHAANPYQPDRHPYAEEKLKHYILSTRL